MDAEPVEGPPLFPLCLALDGPGCVFYTEEFIVGDGADRAREVEEFQRAEMEDSMPEFVRTQEETNQSPISEWRMSLPHGDFVLTEYVDKWQLGVFPKCGFLLHKIPMSEATDALLQVMYANLCALQYELRTYMEARK